MTMLVKEMVSASGVRTVWSVHYFVEERKVTFLGRNAVAESRIPNPER